MKLLCCLSIAAGFFLLAGGASGQPAGDAVAPPAQKRILLLYSYGENFQPWTTWSREIRRELSLRSPWPLDIQEHSLFTALAGDDAADARFIEYLTALYAHEPPDLILALGAPASRFVQEHRKSLFPTTPMLLAAVNVNRVLPAMLSPQDAVVGTEVDHRVLIGHILRLLPDTRTIAIIIGNSAGERLWVDQVRKELKPLLGEKVRLAFFNEKPFAEILEELAHLPPHSAVFFQQLMIDGTGAVYGDKEPLKTIAGVANAPIFTFDQSLFTGEAVGGPMSSPVEGARSTASVAVRLMEGEKPGDIKVPPTGFSPPKYDWRQLVRWKIDTSRLPPGSEILFREPSAWERYSWQITFIAAALLLQAGLIAILLRERHGRQAAEVQSRQRMAELAHMNRISTAGELAASIAHEVNQPLGAILSNAEAANIMLKSPAPDLDGIRQIIGDILLHDQQAAEVIRRMRSLLKKQPFEPESVDLNELARDAVDFLSASARERDVELRSVIAAERLSIIGDRIQLLQVILNLVLNAIEAMDETPRENRVIEIRTTKRDGFARLSVSDGGPGIAPDKLERVFDPFFTTKDLGMGMGLSIARTIIEAHDGVIRAGNAGNGGASFQIELPRDPTSG